MVEALLPRVVRRVVEAVVLRPDAVRCAGAVLHSVRQWLLAS